MASIEDRYAMAESAEASELADDSIDRSDPEDGEDGGGRGSRAGVRRGGGRGGGGGGGGRSVREARLRQRHRLASVPDGSPLLSDYDSDAEPEPEPEHEGPPAYVIPQQLAGKKLVVAVHELRGLPSGYGDGVFCVVECGDALYEATTVGRGAPPRTVWEQWEEFAARFDDAGAHERTTARRRHRPIPGVRFSPGEDEPAANEPATVRETELAYFAFNALELVDDSVDARNANAKLASADGDWVPMEPNPRTPDAVLLNASMEARVTLRVEPAGYTSPESASRALQEATLGLHVAAATSVVERRDQASVREDQRRDGDARSRGRARGEEDAKGRAGEGVRGGEEGAAG